MRIKSQLLITALLLVSQCAFAQVKVRKAVNVPNSPIKIANLASGYSTYHLTNYVDIYWRNVSDKTIFACQFKVVIFNMLKEHVVTYDLMEFEKQYPPGDAINKIAVRQPRNELELTNDEFYNVLILPDRVVFTDGSVWQLTINNDIYAEMKDALGVGFSPEVLSSEACIRVTSQDLVRKR